MKLLYTGYSFDLITSPTYFWTSSEPITRMKHASVRLATARAQRVLPVPGGPKRRTPFGGSIPRLTNLSGCKFERVIKDTFEAGEQIRTYVKQRSFHDFSEFFNLFFTSTDITVCNIGFLFDLHHGDSRVDFGRKRDVNLVLVPVDSYSHSFFNVCGCYRVSQVYNKLGKLLDIDDVLGIIRVCIDDLGASGNLEEEDKVILLVFSNQLWMTSLFYL